MANAALIDASDDNRIPKRLRLLKRGSFQYVGRKGARVHGALFSFQAIRIDDPLGRFGLTVTKKVGNAPTRNRVKRLLRHALAPRKARLKNRHIVVIADPRAATATFHEVCGALDVLFDKLDAHAAKGNAPAALKKKGAGDRSKLRR